MSLEEVVKNNPALMIGSALVAGFSAGIAAFWFVLSASSTDLVDHGAYVSMAELREWIPADDLDERGYIHESDVERSYVLRTESALRLALMKVDVILKSSNRRVTKIPEWKHMQDVLKGYIEYATLPKFQSQRSDKIDAVISKWKEGENNIKALVSDKHKP